MKRSKKISFLLTGLLIVLVAISATIMAQTETVSMPNKKWRIAYVETDPFGNFAGNLYGLVQGLATNGFIENVEGIPYEQGQSDSTEMWNWLASRNVGPYVEFVADAHYSLADGPDVAEQLLARLKAGNDIDLLLAMGTSAGILVANDEHSVPTMVFSASNAVLSGIIESEEDSGRDHIWAHIDSERYKRQIEVFHDIFQFKKLGMMFEDSETGRAISGIEDIKKMSEIREFDINIEYVSDPASSSEDDYENYVKNVAIAFEKLAAEVDAMYTTPGLWEYKDLPDLLEPFYENGVPVFSVIGREEVMHGALMSVARADFTELGLFTAHNFAQIVKGTKPRDLVQAYGETPSIVLNLEVAKKIGYKPPFDILLVADSIYQNIQR